MKERVRRALKNIFLLIVCAKNAVNGWHTIKSHDNATASRANKAMAKIDYFTFFSYLFLVFLVFVIEHTSESMTHERTYDSNEFTRCFFPFLFIFRSFSVNNCNSSYRKAVIHLRLQQRKWIDSGFAMPSVEVGSKHEPMLCNTHMWIVNEINLLHARMQLQLKSGRHRYTVMRY